MRWQGQSTLSDTAANYGSHVIFINEDLIGNTTIPHFHNQQNINTQNATQTQPNLPAAGFNQTHAFYILSSANLPNPAQGVYPMA